MKKLLSIIVVVAVLAAIAYYTSTAKAPAIEQDQAPVATTDTAAAINASVDSVELADPSVDLQALDADINAL